MKIRNGIIVAFASGWVIVPSIVSAQQGITDWPAPQVVLQESTPESSAVAEVGAEPASLEEYLYLAERDNPKLKAAYYRWQGSLQAVPQATSLQDPMLTYIEYIDNNVETRTGAQDFQLGVMQKFPYPGKLSLRGQAASEEAGALRQEYEKARLEVRKEVKDAFYEYYYLERSIQITREILDLLRHFESVAAARYEVARAGNQDVVKAQVELGKLENELQTLEDFRIPVQSRLNAAMSRPDGSPVPPPGEVDTQQIQLAADSLIAQAYETNPELKAIDARIRKRNAERQLAEKDYYPDFNVGLNWINTNDRIDADVLGDGDDPLMASVQINLPIYRKRLAAGVRQAELGVQEAREMREDRENQLALELQTALYHLRDSKRKMDLYSGMLIPKANQSLEVTETAYSAEQAGFLDLIDSERFLLNFQNSYYRAVADHGQALAEIETLVGGELTTIENVAQER